MAWELFNEVQFTDAAQGNQWTNVAAWHNEMAQFIRSQDSYHHLITTSSQLDQPIWSQCDYYQHHDYPADLISALRDPPGVPVGQPVKPIFSGECGSNGVPVLGFQAPLWAGLMGAQSGAAEQWYWDGIDAENSYGLFHSARDFVLASGIAEQDALTKSAPHVTCPVNSSLVFAPGGGWSTATQSTFTVGDSAPDGIGTLPSFLQGAYHIQMTPNGFTFVVNYAVGGTFSVQVVTIAASGASLVVTLDGSTAARADWPSSGADVNTNYTLGVNVPAGQHTIKLTNPGQDWVNLGNITLDPYTPILGAYQIGNTNFAALWVWHRTNIYFRTATTTVSGTMPLGGLQPGNYAATWWDTLTGVALSNFNFTVAGTNAVTVATPAILRSVALFAAPPAQAGVSAPNLTQNLGTNSPALNLPLVITNAGGLPLGYSLCVTGVNPITYTAFNSTEPGGPVFAWKDISAIGRELSTNLTALTAKGPRDEGISSPIGIGFGFPFFSGGQTPDLVTQAYVSPNGFVTFSPFAGDTSLNRAIPSNLAPSNCIACFWDDLDLTSSGKIYCATDSIAGTFTVQFQNAPIKGTTANVTCQLILKTTGEIVMQYKTVGLTNACTVGVQNAARSQGLQAAFNQPYLQSGMAVRFTPTPWLAPANNAGFVPRWSADTVKLALAPSGLPAGTYTASLLVKTADSALPVTVLPVTLNILSPIDQWRLTNFGTFINSGDAGDGADPDHDGLVNLIEYALGRDPHSPDPYPLAFSLQAGQLTLTYRRPHPAPVDISYVPEVTGNLVNPTWNSGPAYVTERVTDNGDSTETVTDTDLAGISSNAAHYLRLRFAR
jgi:hypothetical protein